MQKYIFVLSIFFIMCESRTDTPPIIDQAVFVQLYCDVVATSDRLPQEKRSAFVDSMLAEYNVSKAMFKNTVEYYSQDPQRWKLVFKAISKELENRITQNNTPSSREARGKVHAPKNTIKTPANPKTKP